MTAKIIVTLGGGTAATDLEYTDSVPFYTPGEGGVGHWSFETTFANGDDGLGEFIVDNDDGAIPKSDGTRNLAAKNPVRLTEDASGTTYTLAYGRIVEKDVTRNEDYPIADASQYRVTVQAPGDLALMKLTEDWARDAETDYDRLVALQAYLLNGSASTAPKIWNTVDITVDSTHLAPNTNTVTMPAHTYQAGTGLDEIIEDIRTTAGKVWGIVPHHVDGVGTHKCLEYVLETDNTTYLSTVKISDDPAEIDPVADPPIIAPQWGSPRHEAGQEQNFGLVVRYGSGDNYVYVEGPHIADDIASYDRAVETYYDDQSETAAQATTRGLALIDYARFEHVTHTVILKVRADHAHLIAPGMSIVIHSAAAMSGSYLHTDQTRRIASVQYEPLAPEVGAVEGFYQLTVELDRRMRRVPPPRSSTKPGPKPPTAGSAPSIADSGGTYNYSNGGFLLKDGLSVAGADDDMLIVFVVARDGQPTTGVRWIPDTADVGTFDAFTLIDTATVGSPALEVTAWKLRGPSPSVASRIQVTQGGANRATSGAWYYLKGVSSNTVLEAEDTNAGAGVSATVAGVSGGYLLLDGVGWQATHTAALTATAGANQTQDYQNGQAGAFGDPDAVLATSHQDGANGGVMSWSTIPSSGNYSGAAHIAIALVGTAADAPPPAADDSSGDIGTPGDGCYATCDHKHPAQTAAVTPYDNSTSGLTADETNAAIDELDGRIDVLEAGGGAPTLAASGSPVSVTNDTSHNGFPDIARMANGSLIAVYRKGTEHEGSSADGRIVRKISADDGATWGSETEVYNDATNDVRGAGVAVLRDGTVIVSFAIWDGTAGAGRTNYIIRSSDNGATWGTKVGWTSTLTNLEYESGRVVELANGDLIQPFYGDNSPVTARQARIIRSTDGGDTWGSEVTVASAATEYYTEPTIIRLTDGRYVCAIRHAADASGTPESIDFSFSDDECATWSTPVVGFDGFGQPTMVEARSGAIVCFYRQDIASTSEGRGVYRVSWDRGATWGDETNLESTGTTWDYGNAIVLSDSRIIAIYALKAASTNADIVVRDLTDVTDQRYANTPRLTVSEEDGSPVAHDVTDLRFSNASLTANADGSVSVAAGAAVAAFRWVPMSFDPSGDGAYELMFTDDGSVMMMEVYD